MSEEEEHYFFGKLVVRRAEKEYVDQILAQYKNDPVDNALKQKIWDALQHEKYLGHLTSPFKVVLRIDPYGQFPDTVEVILDTKV